MNPQAIQAASELSIFDMTKAERKSFVAKIIDAIDDGYDPLKIHYRLKVIEKIIETLTDGKSDTSKRYRELLLLEAAKHGKSFEFGNSEIEVVEAGVKYDYSACGDTELTKQMDVLAAMSEAVKKRQEMLKTIPVSGMQILVDDELVTVYPPIKTSTTSIKLTLK